MVEKKQFTLANSFFAMTLMAVALAVFRFALTTRRAEYGWLVELAFGLSMPASCALFGAALGGLFGRMSAGATVGLVLFFIALIFTS